MTSTTIRSAGTLGIRAVGAGVAAGLGLLACILTANYVTTHFGFIPVGFGLMATAGTYFAGLTFVLRDSLQDAFGKKWVLGLIVGGAGLSFLVADPFIAVASAVAFLLSEIADFAVYTPLRARGYIRAAVASNVVGSVIDTVVFLNIAGFPLEEAFAGQMLGKLMLTGVVVVLVLSFRAWRAGRKRLG
ncbi:uncharacterized PurR-regulated membrane protein YhhQ (DUF165 family) [Pseudarthrobacter defluvii]|uniref:VUT family protein n=1 Tax=Pseudarthrobacter defluvii TaxID=410837 RepID=UPI00277EEC20|nr:VUT family protein [Pseudarthrobacter defluvii]MDQ0770245.1 uncharacterized PurR-regulated membrane protein YhhQ (DUF165 family) [Pseudarthrobacter defluvii]